MKRIYVAILVFTSLFISCDKLSLDAPDAIEDLINRLEKTCDAACPSYVHEYRWKNDIIYVQSCGGPACTCLSILYDAAGVRIRPPQGTTENDILKESVLLRRLWYCSKKPR